MYAVLIQAQKYSVRSKSEFVYIVLDVRVWDYMVKQLSVRGGCLGSQRR